MGIAFGMLASTVGAQVPAPERAAAVRPEQHAIPVNITKSERVEAVRAEERTTGAGGEAKAEVRASPVHAEERAPNAKAEKIQCTLLLASNPEKPKAADPEMARIARKIEKVFGYRQIEVVGSDKAVQDGFEHWLVPSQDFWMSVKSKRESEGLYLLDLNIFHGRRRIIETEAKLGADSPLLIRGPMCSRGQLVIVLQIVP